MISPFLAAPPHPRCAPVTDEKQQKKPDAPITAPKGEVHIITNRCKGCNFCIEFCPVKVLASSDSFNEKGYRPPKPAHPEKCIGCKMCELLCPEFAIYVTKPGQDHDTKKQ